MASIKSNVKKRNRSTTMPTKRALYAAFAARDAR